MINVFTSNIQNKSDNFNLFIIGIIWVTMVVAVNPIGNFPLNDDCVYALAVKSVLNNGYYNFSSPSSANVGPQVYWGALFCLPYGFSFTALRLSTLTLGLIGILVFYRLLRMLGAYPSIAVVGVLLVAVNPIYFSLSNTFMTDVPFVTCFIIALYFFVKGLQNSTLHDFALGLITTFLAILIRQIGVVILIGFASAYIVKYGFRFGNIVKMIFVVSSGILLHIIYQFWLNKTGRTPVLSSHSNVLSMIPNSGSFWSIRHAMVNIISYVGLFALPFIVIFPQYKPSGVTHIKLKKIKIILFVLGMFFLSLVWLSGNIIPSLPNILTKTGIGPLTLRDTYIAHTNVPIVPQFVNISWLVITMLAVTSAFILTYYVWLTAWQLLININKKEYKVDGWIFWLLITLMASYFLVLILIAARITVFDRYLLLFLPLIPLLLTCVKFELLAQGRKFGLSLSLVLVTAYGGFAVVSTHDYLSWNRMRWAALENLINKNGVKTSQIDGGYEYNGLFMYDLKYTERAGKSWWWVIDDEFVVTSGPMEGYIEVQRYSFKPWLFLSNRNVFVLRKNIPIN